MREQIRDRDCNPIKPDAPLAFPGVNPGHTRGRRDYEER